MVASNSTLIKNVKKDILNLELKKDKSAPKLTAKSQMSLIASS